jgi:hypothetical protein
MEFLTKQQESFCENAGLFGVMIAITCMIQMMIVMVAHWIPFTVIGTYILCIAGFIMLMKKSAYAFRLLFISSIAIFIMAALVLLSNIFSLLLLILLAYLIVIITLLYMGPIPVQLKKRQLAVMEEEQKWNNVL